MSPHTELPVPPIELINVGDGEFKAVGDLLFPLFVNLGGLRPSDRVLDVGCGIGRMARPLTAYLASEGGYDGFDIVAPSIEWCRTNITPRFPDFRFEWANVFNSVYNPGGTIAPSEYRFPYEDHSFDFVLLTSVFTHMLPVDMEHYFAEIARVLASDGASFITFFLLNQDSSSLIDQGASTLDLRHDFGIYRTTSEANPEHAVAYDERSVLALYEKYGFELPQIHYGSWCGRSEFVSYQDIVTARRHVGRVGRPAESDQLVLIDSITCCSQTERTVAAHLDSPRSVGPHDTYGFDLAGWVVGREEPVLEVHVIHEESVVTKISVRTPRPDVASVIPDVVMDERCGFEGFVGLLGVAPGFELLVRAIFEDETGCDFATLRGRQWFPATDFEPTIQPLMVTSLGRTGTTLLMRLLGEHPEIVIHDEYPFETRAAGYWMHALKVLCGQANHERSSHPDTFHDDASWVGHHPFHCPPVTDLHDMSRWFGRAYVKEVGTFVKRSVEGFYAELGCQARGAERPAYFAEKWSPNDLPWIVWSVYPQARELFLIRDPRDIVSSILAWGKKRGQPSFGRERSLSDEEFIRAFRLPLERFAQSWRRRRDVAHLVRYEDLIRRPFETMKEILDYLQLDSSTVRGIISRGVEEGATFELHRTSSDSTSSVGRWRDDLEPSLREACEQSFGDVLTQLGYEPSGPAGMPGEATARAN